MNGGRFVRILTRLACTLAVVATAGCAGTGPAPGTESGASGSSGITVFGTIDAGVSRTRGSR